jgi:hypothetical protein
LAGFLKKTDLRLTCEILNQSRASQRYSIAFCAEEDRLNRDILELTQLYGRYGYRRIIVGIENWDHIILFNKQKMRDIA